MTEYGKNTDYLEGVEFRGEPDKLSRTQSARGKMILQRVQSYLANTGGPMGRWYSLLLQPIVSEIDSDLIDAGINNFSVDGWNCDPSDLSNVRTLEGDRKAFQ